MRYALPTRLIHWLMALGFLFMWVSGLMIGNVVAEDSSLEKLLFYLHFSIAVTLGALLVLRIAVRLTHRAPPLPAEIRPIERTGAHLAHAALYALPAVIITLGWCSSNIGGHLVHWFGVELPKVFPDAEEFDGLVEGLQMWLAYAMLAVALAHVAGGFQAPVDRWPRRDRTHDVQEAALKPYRLRAVSLSSHRWRHELGRERLMPRFPRSPRPFSVVGRGGFEAMRNGQFAVFAVIAARGGGRHRHIHRCLGRGGDSKRDGRLDRDPGAGELTRRRP